MNDVLLSITDLGHKHDICKSTTLTVSVNFIFCAKGLENENYDNLASIVTEPTKIYVKIVMIPAAIILLKHIAVRQIYIVNPVILFDGEIFVTPTQINYTIQRWRL
jgi:hypothetical protein